MFRAYCASCHGAAGKGDGPVAPALKVPPADLTTLARRNGGRFPAVRVFQSVEGSAAFPAHGSREMPVWGAVFRQSSGSTEAQVKLRVRNLTNYIESMQVK
jgi:mono/diheme cytochrome c family protein